MTDREKQMLEVAKDIGERLCNQTFDSGKPARFSKFSPLTDVVKVVRCKDCKYYKTVEDIILYQKMKFCTYRPFDFAVKDNDFCSYGELKECDQNAK